MEERRKGEKGGVSSLSFSSTPPLYEGRKATKTTLSHMGHAFLHSFDVNLTYCLQINSSQSGLR
ncbi:hypothetical protein E2C01_080081 [Portunus trituberculatus]|uniref:Uncharacterized protein n=1 Tax=Portunus trituberculatus TaxID=210409 RepID=A0A5B7INC2_PORTR|nr:hypothetical protein [Portunus trituberculatus]